MTAQTLKALIASISLISTSAQPGNNAHQDDLLCSNSLPKLPQNQEATVPALFKTLSAEAIQQVKELAKLHLNLQTNESYSYEHLPKNLNLLAIEYIKLQDKVFTLQEETDYAFACLKSEPTGKKRELYLQKVLDQFDLLTNIIGADSTPGLKEQYQNALSTSDYDSAQSIIHNYVAKYFPEGAIVAIPGTEAWRLLHNKLFMIGENAEDRERIELLGLIARVFPDRAVGTLRSNILSTNLETWHKALNCEREYIEKKMLELGVR